LNRIINQLRFAPVFRAKLADMGERFGIEVAQINPAYTSQECSRGGFVDRGNRKSQTEFRCLYGPTG
jgi:putative transposase